LIAFCYKIDIENPKEVKKDEALEYKKPTKSKSKKKQQQSQSNVMMGYSKFCTIPKALEICAEDALVVEIELKMQGNISIVEASFAFESRWIKLWFLQIDVGKHKLNAEVIRTEGVARFWPIFMEKQHIPDRGGLLFVWNDESVLVDMKFNRLEFPLDIIQLNRDKKIVELHQVKNFYHWEISLISQIGNTLVQFEFQRVSSLFAYSGFWFNNRDGNRYQHTNIIFQWELLIRIHFKNTIK
jgi:hypothetical protein